MKMKMVQAILGVAAALVMATGCVSTVTDTHTAAVPGVRDSVTGQYERPVEQVFAAAIAVVKDMGTLDKQGVVYEKEVPSKTIEATIGGRRVWIRVDPVDTITAVTVQVRTKAGGADMDLTHEIEKEIALKLVH